MQSHSLALQHYSKSTEVLSQKRNKTVFQQRQTKIMNEPALLEPPPVPHFWNARIRTWETLVEAV